jgi:hypothetical protein
MHIMETLIDLFELHGHALPPIETYRHATTSSTPAPRVRRESADLDVDVEDPDARIPVPGLSSERWQRARLWSSED